MGIVVDSRITLKDVLRDKPTGSRGRPAAVLDTPGQVSRTPPGSESGACRHRGRSGTWERHRSPGHMSGLGHRASTGPGVAWRLPPRHAPRGDTTHRRQPARYRDASAERSDPRRAGGPSSRSIVPTKGGHPGPRDPRAGRRRRASPCAGETDGRDLESTNRHPNTAAPGGPGGPRSGAGIHAPGPPDRGRRGAGGVPPHASVEGPRDGRGHSGGVRRTP